MTGTKGSEAHDTNAAILRIIVLYSCIIAKKKKKKKGYQ